MKEDGNGQDGWTLKHGPVDLAITRTGGQMAPVQFDLGNGQSASPYSVAPWSPEECPEGTPALLKALRGDFFCFPFGVSELTPHPHGAPANLDWDLAEQTENRLVLALHDPVTGADFRKELSLNDSHRAIYIRHTVENISGQFNYGHHPILEFPEDAGPCAVRTGPIKFGQVYPGAFENPVDGGVSVLKQGARFDSLEEVPLASGDMTSLASYPNRPGSEDLVMFSPADPEFGWTAVHFPGFFWMAIRSCRELPSTLFWLSNGGRPYAPWSSRHVRRLGIEDVCSHFHDGAEISGEDRLASEGIPTSRAFDTGTSTSIHHIQLVHPLEEGFGTVESVERDSTGESLLLSNSNGQTERVPVHWKFLF